MIFLDYLYAQPNLSGGIDSALVSTQASVNIFIPMFLLFIYFTVMISGLIGQKRRTGYTDIPMWSTIAGMGIMFIGLILTLVEGLIDTLTLSIIAIVVIVSGVWLLLDRNRNETY